MKTHKSSSPNFPNTSSALRPVQHPTRRAVSPPLPLPLNMLPKHDSDSTPQKIPILCPHPSPLGLTSTWNGNGLASFVVIGGIYPRSAFTTSSTLIAVSCKPTSILLLFLAASGSLLAPVTVTFKIHTSHTDSSSALAMNQPLFLRFFSRNWTTTVPWAGLEAW